MTSRRTDPWPKGPPPVQMSIFPTSNEAAKVNTPPRPTPAPQPHRHAAGQHELELGPISFKNPKERSKRLDEHREKCKRKLNADLEGADAARAVPYMVHAGHLLSTERLCDANAMTVFISVPQRPDPKESDSDWWARVQDAIRRDAGAIKAGFAEFLGRAA